MSPASSPWARPAPGSRDYQCRGSPIPTGGPTPRPVQLAAEAIELHRIPAPLNPTRRVNSGSAVHRQTQPTRGGGARVAASWPHDNTTRVVEPSASAFGAPHACGEAAGRFIHCPVLLFHTPAVLAAVPSKPSPCCRFPPCCLCRPFHSEGNAPDPAMRKAQQDVTLPLNAAATRAMQGDSGPRSGPACKRAASFRRKASAAVRKPQGGAGRDIKHAPRPGSRGEPGALRGVARAGAAQSEDAKQTGQYPQGIQGPRQKGSVRAPTERQAPTLPI